MLQRETCFLQLKINDSRTPGSSGQEVSAARGEGQRLRDASGQRRLPSQRCRRTPRDAAESPTHPTTQCVVKIERNTPERYTQRPKESSHGGGKAVSRRGARSKLRLSQWGTADQGSVRPERPAPGDGGLQSEGLCGDPGGSSQDWGAGSGGLRPPELVVLPLSPFCCRKGDPFQGPKLGSCLTLGNELSEETHADKARDFIGKGHPGGEQ